MGDIRAYLEWIGEVWPEATSPIHTQSDADGRRHAARVALKAWSRVVLA